MVILSWLYERSASKQLASAVIRSLTKQLGGSAVVPLSELTADLARSVEIRKNDDPEGVRIVVLADES